MCFVRVILFSLCLLTLYPLCGAQVVEEEGCPLFVTISEMNTLFEKIC